MGAAASIEQLVSEYYIIVLFLNSKPLVVIILVRGCILMVQTLVSTNVNKILFLICNQLLFLYSVDTEIYIEDFNSIDKNSDGSISFMELQNWIVAKAKMDPAWGIFTKNPQVVKAAHMNTAKRSGKVQNPDKVVDITDFRNLLMHLFATSVLWAHFQNADNWTDGEDLGNKQLNFEEFKLACVTLCSTHAGEQLTEEQILADFVALDTNNSNSIQFLEVSYGNYILYLES